MELNLPDPTESLRSETRKFLTTYNLTQNWLAEKLNVSRQFVSDFLACRRGISQQKRLELAKVVYNPHKGCRIIHMQENGQEVGMELSHCEKVEFQVASSPSTKISLYKKEQV